MKIAFVVLLMCVVALYAPQSLAAKVTLGFDPEVCNNGDGQETDNMERWLTVNGHTVYRMNDYTDTAGWSYVLSKSSVLIFPEHENGNPVPRISDAAYDKIVEWTQAGGILVVAAGSGNSNLYNRLTGLSITVAGGAILKRGKSSNAVYPKTAGGASFTGPDEVVELDACNLVDIRESIEDENLSCYYGTNAECAMATYYSGEAGGVSYLVCPDFYDFGPIGVQDGGWERTLAAILPPGSTSSAATLSSWASLLSA